VWKSKYQVNGFDAAVSLSLFLLLELLLLFPCSIFHSINLLGGCGNIFLPISNFPSSLLHLFLLRTAGKHLGCHCLKRRKLLNVPGEIVLSRQMEENIDISYGDKDK